MGEETKGWKEFNKGLFSINKDIISIKQVKDLFMIDLNRAIENEKIHCEQTGSTRQFTEPLYNEVVDLLDQCKSFAEVEALAQLLFSENVVPTLEEIRQKGFAIYLEMPTIYEKR